MKRLILISLLSVAAVEIYAASFDDTARVRSVEPRYESISVPRQECTSQWINETRRTGERNYGGAMLGGLAGGVLGHQIGRGNGRDAATAAAAVIGAIAGDRLANRDRSDQFEVVPREIRSCRTVNDIQNRIVGYQVSYEYRGQQFATVMREEPGAYLKVRVLVEPAGR